MRTMLRRALAVSSWLLAALPAVAQWQWAKSSWQSIPQHDGTEITVRRCGTLTSSAPRRLQTVGADVLRGQRRQLVLLVQFADRQFLSEDPKAFWSDVLNTPRYTNNYNSSAPGSLHDYFMAQSSGLLDLTFDVCGPYTLSQGYAYYGESDSEGSSTDKHLSDMVNELYQLADSEQQFAYDSNGLSPYDWDGDGTIDQVIIVYAGYGQSTNRDKNLIWPKCTWLSYTMQSGLRAGTYVVVNESVSATTSQGNKVDRVMGFGLICHEYSHCFGLPDLYDVSTGWGISDRWDIMDGGCYTSNLCWTPVNYSAYERMFCGWLTPEELNHPTTVSDMEPLGNGGSAYTVTNDARTSEYYILENRQQQGWDKYLPGHGLLITHVDYNLFAWQANSVNTSMDHLRLAPIPADGNIDSYHVNTSTSTPKPLTYAAYPYVDASGATVNDRLTDDSEPAATLFNAGPDGSYFMSKPITNIVEASGLVSFRFMDDETTSVSSAVADRNPAAPTKTFDLSGRPVVKPRRGQIKIVNGKKVM